MGFTPSFNALFSGGLVEQCIAIVQNNQAAAIAAYPATPFGVLDPITDYHKAKVAAPQFPCCTVVAGDEEMVGGNLPQIRQYRVPIFVHLDISCTDPDQLADWSYHYARLLDQIFSTLTGGLTNTVVFETAQTIIWPGGSAARNTAAFATGAVDSWSISRPHIGLVPGDESATPVQRISIALDFVMKET